MSFNKKLLQKRTEDLTDKQLKDCYLYLLDKTLQDDEDYLFDIPMLYSIEMNRRSNKKTSTTMNLCTIAIVIMTAVILWATLVGANIIGCGG